MRLVEVPEEGYFLVRLRARKMPMPKLTRGIHVPGDRPVIDQTGLAGKYDSTLEYAYGGRATAESPAPPPAPSIFTALQSQLGLQLAPRRVPLDVIVVDSVSRIPVEN